MLNSVTVLFFALASVFLQDREDGDSISTILPEENWIDSWSLNNDYRHFSYNELTDTVGKLNDIYREFGLKELYTARYSDDKGQHIFVEIYFFEDDEGAYGLYSVNRKDQGTILLFGNESSATANSLNYWAGKYFIRISTESAGNEVKKGVNLITAAIDKGIEKRGNRPALIDALPDEEFVSERTMYFRGRAGLNYGLPLYFEYISGFSEGVYGNYGTYELLILEYDDIENAGQRLDQVISDMVACDTFEEVKSNGSFQSHFIGKDDGMKLIFAVIDRNIVFYRGKEIARQPELFERVEDFLNNYYDNSRLHR